MVPKWCPDVKNKVVKRKTATITRYKKSLCLQGFSQITYKKICGNTGRFWLFHDPRNQFDGDITWVRIPPAAPERRERLLPALFVAAARAYRLKPSSAPSRARPGGLSETRPEADKQAAPARSDALCRSLFALARLSYAFFDAKNLCFQSQHLYCQKLGLPFVGIHQFMPLRTNWRKLLTAGGV